MPFVSFQSSEEHSLVFRLEPFVFGWEVRYDDEHEDAEEGGNESFDHEDPGTSLAFSVQHPLMRYNKVRTRVSSKQASQLSASNESFADLQI